MTAFDESKPTQYSCRCGKTWFMSRNGKRYEEKFFHSFTKCTGPKFRYRVYEIHPYMEKPRFVSTHTDKRQAVDKAFNHNCNTSPEGTDYIIKTVVVPGKVTIK